jgi:hypothetical protein
MRNLISCGIALLMIATVSCTKDDDQVQPVTQTSSSVSERVTYTSHIEPMARKSCSASNCHNGVSANSIVAGRLSAAAHNGTLEAMIFSRSQESPCGKIDEQSIALLQAWVNDGAPVK